MRHLSSSQRILISAPHRPVRAHRDSLFYRAGKFIARYPFAMGASLLVVIILTAGLIRSTLELNRIQHELDRAEASFQTSQECRRRTIHAN